MTGRFRIMFVFFARARPHSTTCMYQHRCQNIVPPRAKLIWMGRSNHEIAIPIMSPIMDFEDPWLVEHGYDKDTLTYLAVQTIFFSSALSLCIFLSCRVRSLWPGWRFFVHLPKAKKHCDLDNHVQIIQINFARGWRKWQLQHQEVLQEKEFPIKNIPTKIRS